MNVILKKYRGVMQSLIIGLPVAGVCLSSLLPLSTVIRQALIAIVLIWFQVSLTIVGSYDQ